jgi:pimeloyl-ACP methyl ester carboxylesterase
MVSPPTESSVQAPPRLLRLLELRAVCERAQMVAAAPALERLPHGDGHPVLVLPGFLADDQSTGALRDVIKQLGYRTFGWDLGTNYGPTPQIVNGIFSLASTIFETEGQKLSIVGWSMGGIYGREIARQYPELVRQVITLGSPVQMADGDQSSASLVWNSMRHLYDTAIMNRSVREHERPPLPVPTTSVYTRTDGIVHWETCLIRRTTHSENVEVLGSHCGMGFNPSVALVVADRLAQPEGDWKRFRSPLWLRGLYPYPARIEAA